MTIKLKFQEYAYLMRLDKPIGIGLLLWPTLWALWLSCQGIPSHKILFIFILGVILMRSAGCVMNDLADQSFDPYVKRTQTRPLAKGTINTTEAIVLMVVLSLLSFFLVLQCNGLTIQLAVMGMSVVILYPFLKRVTHLPQLGLGVAFSWGVPMAFAATTGKVSVSAWYVFLTCLIWPVIYDTMYAMVDREDDLKIGVKSTAILFKTRDTLLIGVLQLLFVLMLVNLGIIFHLNTLYQISIFIVVLLFIYQQWLIKDRCPSYCFQAFLNNHWVGLTIFIGIVLSY
jgi:4-hydroxybenzoate polyprenyltransferase